MAFEKIGVEAVIEGVDSFVRGTRRMSEGLEDIEKTSKLTDKELTTLSRGFRNFGLVMTAAAAAGGAFLFSATRLAARVETLGVVTATLGRNVGMTEEEIRTLEQAIKDEGITLRGTRTAIALMIQSNVDLAQGTKLATLAQNAAVIANINSTEAFERLVFVITSGNVRMARTLGLQVSFQRAYKKTAEAVGKAVTELTEQEKINARTNAVLEAGVNIAGAYAAAMETAGKKVLSLDRHLEESRRILGEAFLPTFADVVDKVTEGFQKFEDLDSTQQRAISTTAAMTVAWTGAIGGVSLLISLILKLKASLEGLALVQAVGLGPIGLALGLFVAFTAAIGGYIAKVKEAKKVTKDLTKEAIKSESTYEEYVKVIEDYAEETGLGIEKTDEFTMSAFGAEQQVKKTTGSIELLSREEFRNQQLASGLSRDYERLEEIMSRTTEETESLEEAQANLDVVLQDLKLTIKTDIGAQFVDYRKKIISINAKIDELEKQKYLTKAQKAQLASLKGELASTREAWDETTKQIIFNLVEQRLALDGFTEAEIAALQKLAGPEGLGLIDEAGAAVIEKIDAFADAMDEAGDEAGFFAEDMVTLQQMLLDPTITVEELANQIDRIRSKKVTITILTVEEHRRKNLPETEEGDESGLPASDEFGLPALANFSALQALAAPAAAAPLVGNTFTRNITQNLTVNTNAPVEPIIADFRALESMASAF